MSEFKKVGLLVGREWSWPPAFIEAVNQRNAGVTAEYAKLGGTKMDEHNPYAVLIDRISHEVPYYRSYLKHAVLKGATVINNPFMWTADDKFFGASLLPSSALRIRRRWCCQTKITCPASCRPKVCAI